MIDSKYCFFLAGLLGVDQLSKRLFYDLKRGAELPFFQAAFNTGISWSLPVPFGVILFFSILGLLLFMYLWKKKLISSWVFVLLFAGTLGNFIDRVWLGGVRDFIRIGNFPIFNFADSYLTIAVVLLLYAEISPLHFKKKKIKGR